MITAITKLVIQENAIGFGSSEKVLQDGWLTDTIRNEVVGVAALQKASVLCLTSTFLQIILRLINCTHSFCRRLLEISTLA